MRVQSIAFFISLALLLVSCDKSGKTSEVVGPSNGVTYVVEVKYGQGATSSDFTRVFAAPVENASSRAILVLSGENLDVRSIKWSDSSNVVICLDGGITDHFFNEVRVPVRNGSLQVKNHLVEHC
jgi:hypothetical protein